MFGIALLGDWHITLNMAELGETQISGIDDISVLFHWALLIHVITRLISIASIQEYKYKWNLPDVFGFTFSFSIYS